MLGGGRSGSRWIHALCSPFRTPVDAGAPLVCAAKLTRQARIKYRRVAGRRRGQGRGSVAAPTASQGRQAGSACPCRGRHPPAAAATAADEPGGCARAAGGSVRWAARPADLIARAGGGTDAGRAASGLGRWWS
jgi:hypothetical protein